jgi:uncharacterized protein YdhG (YjbR/CyaY superfamily)
LMNRITYYKTNGEVEIMKESTPRKAKMSSAARDVDAYIRAAPRESRAKLLQLRRIIKATAPEAKEGISYRIPYYDYYGALVWFAAFKNHVGIFLRPPIIEEHKRDLKGYETTKSAVHFPMDKPLPATLIKKLVRARIAKNKAARKPGYAGH